MFHTCDIVKVIFQFLKNCPKLTRSAQVKKSKFLHPWSMYYIQNYVSGIITPKITSVITSQTRCDYLTPLQSRVKWKSSWDLFQIPRLEIGWVSELGKLPCGVLNAFSNRNNVINGNLISKLAHKGLWLQRNHYFYLYFKNWEWPVLETIVKITK